MIIGSLRRFSLIDYPGKICAVIFTRGCNFRCPYCHNPELVLPARYGPPAEIDKVFAFLEARRGMLQAVCVTGGEPSIHADLPETMRRIKSLGYLVKLDTNGSNPSMLEKLINTAAVDYIAMDVKAPPAAYEKIVGAPVLMKSLLRSVNIILTSGIDHEFRTTVVKGLIGMDELRQIASIIRGAKRYYLQIFRLNKPIDPALRDAPAYSQEELERFANELEDCAGFCGVR
jgi:pyruvate formate lyase activating enzyme